MRYFLLCADPWGRTSPLRRVWCVFEMLVWIDLGGSITLGLTRRGHHTLMTAAADVGDPRVRSQYDQLILVRLWVFRAALHGPSALPPCSVYAKPLYDVCTVDGGHVPLPACSLPASRRAMLLSGCLALCNAH